MPSPPNPRSANAQILSPPYAVAAGLNDERAPFDSAARRKSAKGRQRLIIGFIWVAALAIYAVGAVRQSNHLNLSATAGGQYPYLAYAAGMANEGWFNHFGDRNRMPLYPALLSLIHHEHDETFFQRAKWFALATSILFLAIVVITVYRVVPPWPATAISLVAAFLVFLPQAAFVQAELAYYALFLVTCVLLSRFLLMATWTAAAVAGAVAGLAFLMKASVLPLLVAFLFAAILRAAQSARRSRDNKAPQSDSKQLNNDDPPTPTRMLGGAALVVATFLAVVFPYISNSKERYNRWFYNVNSTFFMWCDSWSDANSFASKHDVARGYPLAAPDAIPGPANYWRTHSLRQILGRISYGITTLTRLAWDNGYLKYVLYAAGLCALLYARRSKVAANARYSTRPLTPFAITAAGGYLIVYAWYVPVAYGDRFLLSLLTPALLVLWWSASRWPKPNTATSQHQLSDRAAKLLIPLLLAEGAYAATVRQVHATPEFISFYYNESQECLRMEDLPEAERGFRGVLQLDPSMTAPRRDLGMVALSTGRADEAINWLESAAHLAPAHADGWNSLGGAYMAKGRVHDAVSAFRRATELDPDLAIAWYNFGGSSHRLGDERAARAALDRLRRLDATRASQLERLLTETEETGHPRP